MSVKERQDWQARPDYADPFEGYWPDWQDSGSLVDVRYQGREHIGVMLEVVDFGPGPDENPYFGFTLDGVEVSIVADGVEWRWHDDARATASHPPSGG